VTKHALNFACRQPILEAGDERVKWRWALSLAFRRRRDDAALNLHLERAMLSFAYTLLATLHARDRRTALHSLAVAIYARDIAARLGLSEAEQQYAADSQVRTAYDFVTDASRKAWRFARP
jgi:HD-GYP domain-containing protein (c-di-GMP phosphodiesterase class II)